MSIWKRKINSIFLSVMINIICAQMVFAAYSFQTFSASEVLTAAKMNQVEINIRDHVHGAGVVSELSAYARLADNETITGAWVFKATSGTKLSLDTNASANSVQIALYSVGAIRWLLEKIPTSTSDEDFGIRRYTGGAGGETDQGYAIRVKNSSGKVSIKGIDTPVITDTNILANSSLAITPDPNGQAQWSEQLLFGRSGIADNTFWIQAGKYDLANSKLVGYTLKLNPIGGDVNIANNQLVSTLTTGTAPLSVTSTTVNTNFNADMVDGLHVGAAVSGYVRGITVQINDDRFLSPWYTYTDAGAWDALWKSFGPTGSGANVIWTALDSVPTTAKAIIINMRINNNGTGYTFFSARKNGSNAAMGAANEISIIDNNILVIRTGDVIIPVASRKFDLGYDGGVGVNVNNTSIFLVGWIE